MIKRDLKNNVLSKTTKAVEMRKNGYSIRRIMTELGYKSPRSVQLLINRFEKDLCICPMCNQTIK